jgi:hypothetical protein
VLLKRFFNFRSFISRCIIYSAVWPSLSSVLYLLTTSVMMGKGFGSLWACKICHWRRVVLHNKRPVVVEAVDWMYGLLLRTVVLIGES